MQARHLAPAAFLVAALSPAAAQETPARIEIRGHVLKPVPLAPTEERIQALDLPDGFRIDVFADGLVNPRMLAVAADGTVYVTRRDAGDVMMLRDGDGDGVAELRQPVASRPGMHGIAIDGRRIYLATVNDVYVADLDEDGTPGPLERIIDDLPDGGQHPNRTLGIGPDGKLYISVGSTCNACGETNPENATILQASPDGKTRRIYASGLRNTIGFDWEPGTGRLYGFDHGMDWLGDDTQQEELNRIEDGKMYGWPYVFENGRPNLSDEPPGGITHEQWARMSEPPVLGYTPHAAPMQMAFYEGAQFPEEYRGDAFVAMRGSWNRRPPAGYEIVRVDFEDGQPKSVQPFVTGFLVEQEDGSHGQLGRLAGLAITPDGALLFSDDENGVIYRVIHADARIAETPGATPDRQAAAMEPAAGTAESPDRPTASVDRLAMNLLPNEGARPLDVISTAFADGRPIPLIHSDYSQGVSPPLSWSAGPEGTGSYVVLMEDPDVPRPEPFLHWAAYDIPAHVQTLREALPTAPRLLDPEGILQGRNDYGATGYFGMKPPDDRTHRYHFQVFAIDGMLNLDPAAGRAELLDAMRGRVLAEGVLVGTFEKPQMVDAMP